MAHFAVHGTWRSVFALTALFTFLGMLVYALAGGTPPPADVGKTHAFPIFGGLLYVAAFAVMILGFWSKEDVIAVLGIMSIAMLIILDILLRVGVLSYNGIKVV